MPSRSPRTPSASLPRAKLCAAVGLAVVGVVLRFWTRSPLWLDEALTANIAQLPLSDIPAALRSDGHPPLYYFMLHGWIGVWGDGDSAVRALSGVLAVLTLPVAWRVGKRIDPRSGGWALVGLLLLSPFAIRYATEARMYSLVVLLVFVGYLLLSNALERTTWARLVAIGLASGALVLTHYWSIWLLAATLLVLAHAYASTSDAERRRRSMAAAAAIVVGCLALVPWLGIMLDQAAHTGTPWGGVARPATLVTATLRDFGGGDFSEATLLGWVLAGLAVVGLFARAVDRDHLEVDVRTQPAVRHEASVVALTMALAWAGSVLSGTTYATRYAAVVLPPFLVVAAHGLVQLGRTRMLPFVVVVLLVLGGVGGVANVVTDRTQAGAIATAIRSGAEPDDLVVICPDQLGPSISRGLPRSLADTALSYPALDTPAFVDWRDYEERNAAADPGAIADEVLLRAEGAPSVWLVVSDAYRTLEGQCEALRASLADQLGEPGLVVAADGDTYGEAASLLEFDGPG